MRTLLAAAACLPLAACTLDSAVDEPTSADEVGSVTQDVSSSTLTYYNCANSGCWRDLGSMANQTCFLAGVRGALDTAYSSSNIAYVAIETGDMWNNDNHYHLVNYTNGPTSIGVACIPNVGNRAFAHSFGSPEAFGGTNSTQRRCFLTGGIFGAGRSQGGTAGDYYDKIYVGQSGGSWVAAVTNTDSEAWGVCVDVPTLVGRPAYGHDTTGTISGTVASNSTGGVACGLSSLNGAWGTNYDPHHTPTTDVLAPYPGGVAITYQSPNFVWEFDNHTGAEATCVR